MIKALYFGLDPLRYQKHSPYQIVHCPLINTLPRPFEEPSLQEAFACFDRVSHLLLTSRSAVFLWNQYLIQGACPVEVWQKKKVLAIGRATEEALQGLPSPWTCSASYKPQKETSEGICALLPLLSPQPSLLLWPHSALSRSTILESLHRLKIPYLAPILYDTVFEQPARLPPLEEFQVLIFSSPSTIDAFLQLYGSFPNHALLETIGPTTHQYLSLVLQKIPPITAVCPTTKDDV